MFVVQDLKTQLFLCRAPGLGGFWWHRVALTALHETEAEAWRAATLAGALAGQFTVLPLERAQEREREFVTCYLCALDAPAIWWSQPASVKRPLCQGCANSLLADRERYLDAGVGTSVELEAMDVDAAVHVYDALLAAGCEVDHHETDLYVKRTPVSELIVTRYHPGRSGVRVFRSQIDGLLWFDVPFAYLPAWEAKAGDRWRNA